MAASVRVDDEAFSDGRIDLLGELAGYNRFEALGRLAHLWRTCTDRETHVLSETMVIAYLGPKGPAALLGAELGERVDGGIRIRGTEGRIEWIGELRGARQRAGQARANGARRGPDGRLLPSTPPAHAGPAASTPPAGGQRAPAKSSALAPALVPDQIPEGEGEREREVETPPRPPAETAGPATIPVTPESDTLGGILGAALHVEPPATPRQSSPLAPGRPKAHPAAQSPHREAAGRLWARQEAARARLNPRCKPLTLIGVMGKNRLKRIEALLVAGWSEPDLEQVVDAHEAESRRNPEALRWFDGTTNWRPANVDRVFAQIGTPRGTLRSPPGAPSPAPSPPKFEREPVETAAQRAARVASLGDVLADAKAKLGIVRSPPEDLAQAREALADLRTRGVAP